MAITPTTIQKKKALVVNTPAVTPKEIVANPSGTIRDATQGSTRAPIQSTLTRDQKISQMQGLRNSASRYGVLPSQQTTKSNLNTLSSTTGRDIQTAGNTDQNRMKAVQDTVTSTTQVSLPQQLAARDEQRSINLMEQQKLQENQSMAFDEGIKNSGFANLGISSKDLNNPQNLRNKLIAGVKQKTENGKVYFEGLSADPRIREAQIGAIGFDPSKGELPHAGTFNKSQEYLQGLANQIKSGINTDVGLTSEQKAEFNKQRGIVDLSAARASATTTDSQNALREFQFNMQELNRQRQESDAKKFQEKLETRDALMAKQQQEEEQALSRIVTGNSAVRDALSQRAKASIQDKYTKLVDSQMKAIDAKYQTQVDSIQEAEKNANLEYQNAESKAQGTTMEDQVKADEEARFQKKIAEGKGASQAKAEIAYENAQYAKDPKAKQIADQIDDLETSNLDDSVKFEKVLKTSGGNQEDVYKGFKDKYGEAYAKSVRNKYWKSIGRDEDTIEADEYAQDWLDLYNGEKTSNSDLNAFVQKSKKMGIPNAYLTDKLRTLQVSTDLDDDLIDGYIDELAPKVSETQARYLSGNLDANEEEAYLKRKRLLTLASNVSAIKSGITAGTPTIQKKGVISGVPRTPEGVQVASEVKSLPAEEQLVIDKLSRFSPDVLNQAKSMMEPDSKSRIKDLSKAGNFAGLVDQAMSILRAEERRKNPGVIGFMRASAGGDDPSVGLSEKLSQYQNVSLNIEDLYNEVTKFDTGPFVGTLRQYNPYDVNAGVVKARLSGMVSSLARGVYGEKGVLTDADVALYQKTLPNIKYTDDLNKLILSMTIKTLQRGMEAQISSNSTLGVDFSGYEPIYKDLQTKSENLLSEISKTNQPQVSELEIKGYKIIPVSEIRAQGIDDVGLGILYTASRENPDMIKRALEAGYTFKEILNSIQK